MGLGSVGCEILGFLAELVLDLGSVELVEERPVKEPLEFERLNHLVGLDRNEVKPFDGDADRGNVNAPPGERAAWFDNPASGGLNVLTDGAPRRGPIYLGSKCWTKE